MSLPPLLFVHGALADGRMWSAHAQRLSDRFEIFAPTLSHFGQDAASAEPFDPSRHIDEIADWVRRIDMPVSVVAWSYSALPAALAALEAPAAIAQLLLFETGHSEWLSDPSEAAAFEADAQAFYGPVIGGLDKGVEQAARAMIDGSGGAGAFDRQPEQQRAIQVENLASLPAMFAGVPFPDVDIAPLASLQVPLTVWWGSDSRDIFRIPSRAAAAFCGDSRSGEIAGVNHLWPVMDEDGFAEAVAQWALSGPAAADR